MFRVSSNVNHNEGATVKDRIPLVGGNTEFRLKIYSLARAMPASITDNHVAAVKTQPLSQSADP